MLSNCVIECPRFSTRLTAGMWQVYMCSQRWWSQYLWKVYPTCYLTRTTNISIQHTSTHYFYSSLLPPPQYLYHIYLYFFFACLRNWEFGIDWAYQVWKRLLITPWGTKPSELTEEKLSRNDDNQRPELSTAAVSKMTFYVQDLFNTSLCEFIDASLDGTKPFMTLS